MKHKISLFAIACAVVATIVAPLALLFYFSNAIPAEKHIILLTLWCILPLVWGVWSLLVPGTWLPNRLPYWGGILGILLGGIIILGFDFPNLIFDLSLSIPIRVFAILFIGGLYSMLWLIVKKIYVIALDH